MTRATQRVVRSLIQWGVLKEMTERGVFSATPRVDVTNGDGTSSWLVEAGISNCDRPTRPLRSLLTSSVFFPFMLPLSPLD
ncbi:MAG: hypothetical protein KAY24_18690 [Candidatus Eisenbacteria sp.]|nr:hypothetical protein [Candidatus Eisenbacteria bacterium]